MQRHFIILGLLLAIAVSATTAGFDCRYYSGGVLLEAAVITPAQCLDLGGNCCTWDGFDANNDGLGMSDHPGNMIGSSINCRGCYRLRG